MRGPRGSKVYAQELARVGQLAPVYVEAPYPLRQVPGLSAPTRYQRTAYRR